MAQRRMALKAEALNPAQLHENWGDDNQTSSSTESVKLPRLERRRTNIVGVNAPKQAASIAMMPRDSSSSHNSLPQLQRIDDPPPTPRKVDVSKLATFEIMEMLRDRGKIPSGFYEDDQQNLQAVLDQEYLEAVEARERFYASVAQAKNENVRVASELRKLRRQHDEELAFLKKNPHIESWLDNLHRGVCAKHFSLANSKLAGVRYILKAMPPTCPLRILDLRHCSINDDVGLTIGYMLRTNRSLESLDVSENHMGCEALLAIAEVQINFMCVCGLYNVSPSPNRRCCC